MPDEVTIAEAARRLNKSPETIRRQIKAGILEGHKLDGPHGREWRVVLPTSPEDGKEPPDGATLPAVQQERLLAALAPLAPLATKSDVERIIGAVDRTRELETALGEALERVRELEGELAEAKRPWWRRRR